MAWRRNAVTAMLASVAAAATDGVYYGFIRSQDATSPNAGVVPFLIAYIAAVALIAALSVWLILSEHRTIAKTMLVAAAAGCGALGILAIFSIGLGLLITAGLLAMAALGVAPQASRLPQLAGALGAIGVLVAGFTLTGVFWGS